MRRDITKCCRLIRYGVIDANSRVTGRDFLLKIWKLIASTPLSVGILHEDMPIQTQANIFYELGVAQALGKETVIVKSANSVVPSDFVRSDYVTFDKSFEKNFMKYLEGLSEQASHYEIVSEQLDRNPILAIDYLRRAYLITGNKAYRKKAQKLLGEAGVETRAKNSVELLIAAF